LWGRAFEKHSEVSPPQERHKEIEQETYTLSEIELPELQVGEYGFLQVA
jgi:hypothetical protein